MSEFRVEKRREAAEIMWFTGATVTGHVFLSESSQLRAGPDDRFRYVELADRPVLVNSQHMVSLFEVKE